MSENIIVIAPHPDDETLGCGGTILKHKAAGDSVSWVIVTSMSVEYGFPEKAVQKRNSEIDAVSRQYGLSSVHRLDLPTTRLDAVPFGDIVKKLAQVFETVQPQYVYVPYPGDIHSDHNIVFNAAAACTKWFRYPSVKRIMAYETLSETDFGINPDSKGFRPNVFVDITEYLDNKAQIMKLYIDEVGAFPFPRSEEAVRALAAVRGASAGVKAAESFMLLKEVLK